MILSREQIDALHGSAHHDDCWMCDIIATALAYHDLRDAVLALCDEADRNHEAYLAGIIMDRFIVPSNVTTGNLRALVARVERGEAF